MLSTTCLIRGTFHVSKRKLHTVMPSHRVWHHNPKATLQQHVSSCANHAAKTIMFADKLRAPTHHGCGCKKLAAMRSRQAWRGLQLPFTSPDPCSYAEFGMI